ncbi:MAG: gliding motility-associated ABC transporter substrate-binding protein GldG [Sphingobacteriales bacterium]|nr:MAG: gliding motility-associated ABC transporter substrate-binding protein GldG [Sphingobacteriales bacterium]
MKGKKTNALWWIGLLAGLVAINFIASKLHYRVDLTEEKRYSLTSATKELVRNMPSDVVIDVFLKGEFPTGFRKLSNTTQEFLSILKETNPARIKYRFISPDEDAGNGKTWGDSLRSAGVEPINLTVQQKGGEENKFIFPYAVISGNGESDIVNLFPSSRRSISAAELNNAEALLEYSFTKAINKLVNTRKPSVAYAIGNGQPEGPETFSLRQAIDPEKIPTNLINPKLFQRDVKGDYEFGIFNLTEQAAIPPTIDVLLIVKPSLSFSEQEKLKIDQYIMRGGKVIWFIDNLYAEQDSLRFKPELVAYDRNLNLGDLLFNYGVRINSDLIMDLQCDFLKFIVGGTSENPQEEILQWNYWPLLQPNSEKRVHPIVKNMGLVAGRYVNSIDTVESDGIRKSFLLVTSSNSRSINTPALISLNENKAVPEHALFKRNAIPTAVILEGKFSSLYRNRLSRNLQDSFKAYGGYLEMSTTENKMIVVADGDVVLNDMSEKEGPLPLGMNNSTFGTKFSYPSANKSFLLNCLEYLTGNIAIVESRNKEVVLRLLDLKKVDAEKGKWQLINIALPIALIILFGIAYQRIRRYRFASA